MWILILPKVLSDFVLSKLLDNSHKTSKMFKDLMRTNANHLGFVGRTGELKT